MEFKKQYDVFVELTDIRFKDMRIKNETLSDLLLQTSQNFKRINDFVVLL